MLYITFRSLLRLLGLASPTFLSPSLIQTCPVGTMNASHCSGLAGDVHTSHAAIAPSVCKGQAHCPSSLLAICAAGTSRRVVVARNESRRPIICSALGAYLKRSADPPRTIPRPCCKGLVLVLCRDGRRTSSRDSGSSCAAAGGRAFGQRSAAAGGDSELPALIR